MIKSVDDYDVEILPSADGLSLWGTARRAGIPRERPRAFALTVDAPAEQIRWTATGRTHAGLLHVGPDDWFEADVTMFLAKGMKQRLHLNRSDVVRAERELDNLRALARELARP